MAKPRRPLDPRSRQLARIHALKRDLGLDDDNYRAVLWGQCRVNSAKDLDSHGRAKVIAHFEALLARSGKPMKRRQRPALDKQQLVAKVRALLMSATPPRDDAYADGMARRMFRVDQFTWCDTDQLWRLVAALSIDQRRRQANPR